MTLTPLLYTAVPVATAVAGSAVAAWRRPTPRVSSYIQHFAAGIVFAALAVEILPDVVHRKRPVWAMAGFAIGVLAMLAVRAVGRRFEGSDEGDNEGASSAAGLAITVGVDVLIDGLLLGVAFSAGEKAGMLLTVALATELLSLGLATSAALAKGGTSRGRSVAVTSGIALLLPLGALAGVLGLSGLPGGAMEAVLAFAAAALLYLVTEELLVEAHEVPETPLSTAMFFVGFLALLMTEMMM